MPDAPTLATVNATPSAPPAAGNAPAQQAAPAPAQRVTPGTPEWAALSAEQRHAALRGPENPRARGHSPAVEQREAAAARAAGEPPAGNDPQTPPANSAEKMKIGKYEVSEAELASMMERQSQDDLRKATLPPTPADYKLTLPETLQLPAGTEYRFDEAGNKATFDAARAWAHSRGLDQSAFSEMLGLYASHEAQQNAVLAARARAEVEKAGVNAPQRVDAVGKWITGEMGEADAKQIRALIVTDSVLRFYERLMQKQSSQGTASFSQSHRASPETNGIPGFEKMSFEQRRLAQDQNAARRR